MSNFFSVLLPTVVAALVLFVVFLGVQKTWQRSLAARRTMLIDEYDFPPAIVERLHRKYIFLPPEKLETILRGLREYFHVCHAAGRRRMVSMPSQAVDAAWHEFILFTREYEQFCAQALGRFLHHTPAEAMQSPTRAQDGIKLAWKLACKREGIDPKVPASLPLLFAIDEVLGIPDGFYYSLDCVAERGYAYCASHIGCSSCSSGDGNDADGGSDGGGDGGGCGGD